jgi:3-oxoacyl-[acyl-carrier protein] reductase
MSQLQGKVSVITGSGRGLGKSAAIHFGKEGAKVVVVGRTQDEVEHTASGIRASGGEAIAVPTDITDLSQVKALFQRVEDAYGKIAILVNNAGIGVFGPVEELSPEELEMMLSVNLKGTVYCSQEVFKRMKGSGGGHIINVVSSSGKVGRANESGYAASKWGVAGFTESLRVEGKSFGIRVTSFCPGGMNTSFWDTPTGRKLQPNSSKFMDPDQIAAILLQIAILPENMVIDDILIRRN